MKDLKITDVKKKLIIERNALFAKLTDNDLSVDDTETPDPVDLAVQNYSKNVMLAVSENDSRQLQMIDEALQRIKDKKYGSCQNCDKPILSKRLKAIPWARFCLNCQELVERGMAEPDTL